MTDSRHTYTNLFCITCHNPNSNFVDGFSPKLYTSLSQPIIVIRWLVRVIRSGNNTFKRSYNQQQLMNKTTLSWTHFLQSCPPSLNVGLPTCCVVSM